MTSAWGYVDSDDEFVADLLAGTLEVVAELGGWVHPQARLVARDGQLSLTCGAARGTPLVRLPSAAFLPVGRVAWAPGADQLEILQAPDDLTGAQVELLHLQVALHNACRKLPWLARTHPVLDARLPDDVIEAVHRFRPSFRMRQPSAAELLWSLRAFRLPGVPGGTPEPMALPIVDLLNHHHQGSTGQWTGSSFDVDVRTPVGTAECALDYGLQRDAIGMAVVYGFADLDAPLAHSAPVDVDVPGVGSVRVLARGRSRTGRLLPPVVTPDAHGATVSRVAFGDGDFPAQLARAGKWTAAETVYVMRAVGAANLELLDALQTRASAAVRSPAASVLLGAAARQRAIVASTTSGTPPRIL